MATNKANGSTGTALDPRTFGGSRGIALVASGAVQQVAFADAVATKAAEGLTLEQARIRLIAAHAPLWGKVVGHADFGFMVGKAPAGKVGVEMHAYRHDAPKGTKVACVGGHGVAGSTCKATAPSMGDNVRRYRMGDAYTRPEYDGNAPRTIALAVAWLGECIGSLAARGASTADMLATPSIAWYAAQGAAFAGVVQGKATRSPRKPATKPDGKAPSAKRAPRKVATAPVE